VTRTLSADFLVFRGSTFGDNVNRWPAFLKTAGGNNALFQTGKQLE